MANYTVGYAPGGIRIWLTLDPSLFQVVVSYNTLHNTWEVQDAREFVSVTHYFKDPSKPTTNELLMVELHTGLPVHMVADYIKENEL